MKAFIITLGDNEVSQASARRCVQSIERHRCELDVTIFPAATPDTNAEAMWLVFDGPVQWTWPTHPQFNRHDPDSGLYLSHYPAVDNNRVVACALSHALLWKLCIKMQQPICILEHDAVFMRQFREQDIRDVSYTALALNDPRGATRRASLYHKLVSESVQRLSRNMTVGVDVPDIDGDAIQQPPQGLPGNSAYIMTPRLAEQLLRRIAQCGLWPNDALMCRQLFDGLKIAYPYYTTIQDISSTTTKL